MPLIGAHVSIAGGIVNAPTRAAEEGLNCFQIFTRSPRGGKAPELTDDIAASFRAACAARNQNQWVVHTPYYINLASSTEQTRKNSARVIREELDRSSMIGALACMTHLGSSRDVGEEVGIAHVIDSLNRALDGYEGSTQFLIEIAAGAGAIIGGTFDVLARILDGLERKDVGICFDTQHAFGAGYDLRTPEKVTLVMDEFDKTIGINKLVMSHVNDSKVDLGEHKDRHEHIGKGKLGAEGVRACVTHPAFRTIPLILETPSAERARDIAQLKKFLKD
jgi:deoxyribonuclease IV